jgi:hypothetical protein
VVVKFSLQSRAILIWPVPPDTGPANDGRLPTANIQGFKILQWRSLPTCSWFGYHTSQALTTSLRQWPQWPFGAPKKELAAQNMAIPPLT